MPTLLLVDDDPAVREVLREFVQMCCPQFSIVGEGSNGQEAVELVQQLRPDVVLMDIRMPILDGIQATRRIKHDLKLDVVVITFTSYAWPELERDARQAGAQYHLHKPFALDQLQSILLEASGS